MMSPGLLLVLALPATLGLPLGCVGLVLRLCEWSWGKEAGSMGSTWLLLVGGLPCAPAAAYLAWAAVGNLLSTGKPF